MSSELTLRHHIANYTFTPVILVLGAVILSAVPLWYGGYVSYNHGMAAPWGAMALMCLWIVLFGDYVMPKEMYREKKAN